MARKKLKVFFFGEQDSTFSRLHYEALKDQTKILWFAGRDTGKRRESFRLYETRWNG